MQQGIFRAAVLYNVSRDEYLLINPETVGGDPLQVSWSWVANPNDATKTEDILELQYYLTDTPIGDPKINSYPWEIQQLYFLT